MTRSPPYMSSSGKPTPQSITIISFPYSRTVQFLPISSRPPRGIIFSFSANLDDNSFQNVHGNAIEAQQAGSRFPQNPTPNRRFLEKTPAMFFSLREARPRLPNARVKPVPGAGEYSITQFREKVYNFFAVFFTDLTEKELHLLAGFAIIAGIVWISVAGRSRKEDVWQ